MSVLDIAGATRSQSAYVTLSALDAFPQFTDSDNYTRALAQRDTDGAVVVVYARGAVRDIVSVHNERSRVTHERSEASAALKSRAEHFEPAEVPEDDEQASDARALIVACDEQLATLPKSRAMPTLHVARALAHYETVSETAPESDSE